MSTSVGNKHFCIFTYFPPHFSPFCHKMRKDWKKHGMKHIWTEIQRTCLLVAIHIILNFIIHFFLLFKTTFFCSVKHLPTNLIRVHPFLSFFTRTRSVTVLAQLLEKKLSDGSELKELFSNYSGTKTGTQNAQTE